MSTSSASGSTATVAAEVWIRPWVSVAGTRWTRCTPDSRRSSPYASGAAHGDDRFLDAAEGAVAQRHRLPAEAVALGKALIHAVEVGGEQRGLVAAGTGADLHDGVAVVMGVARDQQLLQLARRPRRSRGASGPRSARANATSSGSASPASSRACSSSLSSRASRSARRTIGASRACSRPSDCSCAGSRATAGSARSRSTSSARCSAWRSRASMP